MIERSKNLVSRYRLAFMVLGALVIAIIMTMISLSLYVSSGASKLDLSRPGYEKAREEVVVDDQEDTPFSPTGTLDKTTMTDFQERFSKQREEINSLGTFDDDALSDETLQLQQSEQ